MKAAKSKIIGFLLVSLVVAMFAIPAMPAQAKYVYVDFYRYDISKYEETAYMKGYDKNGNQLWYYQCGFYEKAQMPRITWIGINDSKVYFIEDGDVVALDLETGYEKWRNTEFGGVPTDKAHIFSSTGKLYLSGYYGPDFFVVDKNGKTVGKKSKVSDSKTYWPDKIWFTHGDYMKIHFSSNNKTVEFDVTKYFY